MVVQYQRASANRSVWDQLTATHIQDMSEDLDALFKRLDPRDLSFTYNISNQLTQIVDNINSITINYDRTDFADPVTPKIYIQEVWDPKIFTVSYVAPNWPISTITYA